MWLIRIKKERGSGKLDSSSSAKADKERRSGRMRRGPSQGPRPAAPACSAHSAEPEGEGRHRNIQMSVKRRLKACLSAQLGEWRASPSESLGSVGYRATGLPWEKVANR